MNLLSKLENLWRGISYPCIIYGDSEIYFSEIISQDCIELLSIKRGDVVAIIGDFDPKSIFSLLYLIDIGAIVVPLTAESRQDHDYFFQNALVDIVIENGVLTRLRAHKENGLIDKLKQSGNAGLILFSTGTTGRPKAILHDFSLFLKRYETPRQAFRTISFLLFDHIGGINTLFHTLFNVGTVIIPKTRTVNSILKTCTLHRVELLPTTPTFLRMLLISDSISKLLPSSLKIITYGTERMDQPTLDELCLLMPSIDFRQTYGMSELGILRITTERRDSLFMKIGGEGVETKIENNVLHIRSSMRMMGYLNSPSPFDEAGWYNTNDVVDEKQGFIKIIGRSNEIINVGGLKFMPSEVERVALLFPDLSLVKAYAKINPITGQHVELLVEPSNINNFNKDKLLSFLKNKLPSYMVPRRIIISSIPISHRFKKV